ncbi:GntR family transcriptional regulator [Aestuariivirga sp.]|uniref:GntR family transcriptional regulator n=1 Tax=Aestuariivirga sp. TaxID=2650926 RepID=UPI003BA96682
MAIHQKLQVANESIVTLERRKSLAEQVADNLVEAIGLGNLSPGERILETEIAARLKVSRVPVREAFKVLATQGILQGEPHRGMSVIEVNEKVINEICDARIAVETLAVRSLRADPERVGQLATALSSKIAILSQRIRVGDLVAINHADIDFHRQLCELSGNRIATTLWQAIARHIWIVFGWEIRSETSISRMVEQHERLARALTSGSDSKAEDELIQHIRRRRR